MSFQKIFILGAGAIGSCYGALLSGKNGVTLIGNRAHVDAVKTHGLMIKGDIEGKFPVKAETRIAQVPANSLIILTTKTQDAVEAATRLKPLLKSDTVLLVLQNGLRIKELIQRAVGGKCEVVRGLVLMGAEFLEPGKITFWNGPTIIERTKTGEKIRALFEKSGLKTRVAAGIEREEWNKLVVNCVVNPLTAILRVRNNEIGVASLKELRHGIVEECSLVAEAEGIQLKQGLQTQIDRKIRSYTNYSSMYQDIAKGKKTEIDFLNGKIVELGTKHGIPTPFNETLVSLVRFMEARK
jgi:2-dehydropantoate 2-reductase